ncbi:hypothetical protein PsYK624_129150 [Phanerochaete sordida]|uniref:Uncharacterized protein n=1 Tax=Phanerochaete sordida TaxID=48140 RepID=A0A9P3GNP2_9APHY|nr:hypothetical protein PsYK624_129150 [Phanerochaete sordida]
MVVGRNMNVSRWVQRGDDRRLTCVSQQLEALRPCICSDSSDGAEDYVAAQGRQGRLSARL